MRSLLLAVAVATAAPGPPLATPQDALDAALTCPAPFRDGARDPILLVHGTATNAEESWTWGYTKVLAAEGYDVCTVDLPERALVDIQVSVEYVVSAVRRITDATGERVDVIGHSQGTLQPRWAAKWWPDVRAAIDDMVLLASPAHGVASASGLCRVGTCAPSIWQMNQGSKFTEALNRGDETPGAISYTSIYSQFDELVQPPETAPLDGASNVLVQDLCPARPVHHGGFLHDAVVYAVVVDALAHPGPADPSRVDAGVCTETTMPGVEPISGNLLLYGPAFAALVQGPQATAEPPVAAYATAEPPPTPAAAAQAPAPQEPKGGTEVLAAGGGRLAATGPGGGGAFALGVVALILAALFLRIGRKSA